MGLTKKVDFYYDNSGKECHFILEFKSLNGDFKGISFSDYNYDTGNYFVHYKIYYAEDTSNKLESGVKVTFSSTVGEDTFDITLPNKNRDPNLDYGEYFTVPISILSDFPTKRKFVITYRCSSLYQYITTEGNQAPQLKTLDIDFDVEITKPYTKFEPSFDASFSMYNPIESWGPTVNLSTLSNFLVKNASPGYRDDLASILLKVGSRIMVSKRTITSTTTSAYLEFNEILTGFDDNQNGSEVSIILKNRRGFVTTKVLGTYEDLVVYKQPVISFASAERVDSEGEHVGEETWLRLKVDYEYFNLEPNSIFDMTIHATDLNSLVSSNPVSISPIPASGEYFLYNAELDLNKKYNVYVRVIDEAQSVASYTIPVDKAAPYTMDFLAGGNGIAFGKVSEKTGFECDMDADFNKSLNVDGHALFNNGEGSTVSLRTTGAIVAGGNLEVKGSNTLINGALRVVGAPLSESGWRMRIADEDSSTATHAATRSTSLNVYTPNNYRQMYLEARQETNGQVRWLLGAQKKTTDSPDGVYKTLIGAGIDNSGEITYNVGSAKNWRLATYSMGLEGLGGYLGMRTHNDSDQVYIRTTKNGLIPYSENATDGDSSIGTSNWPFKNIHGMNIFWRNRNLGSYRVLATPNASMIASQSYTLSQTISSQPQGIVLVWSATTSDGSAVSNADFQYHFISKYHIANSVFVSHGINLPMMSQSYIGCKYIFITDSKITGSSRNATNENVSGTNNVTFNNKHWALRVVLGV